ncbi:MAG: xanthine dehydrogenase family protein molybdopterin-binding subunit, partial [Thaumarchaeota archaeon]|nr:xanthine dehydrogenase family protein molybdopterin-binding subunit [Nitrososphaerota archaeon]
MSRTRSLLESPKAEIELKYVNSSIQRFEDLRLTSGSGAFMDDLPTHVNTHHVSIVRSTYAHARIKEVRTRDARELPGVRAVLTPNDLAKSLDPLPLVIRSPIKYYPFALEKVRYVGEPVAMVIAKDRFTAEDASSRVEVEYEPLQAVVGSEAAIASDAHLLHETVGSNIVWKKKFEFGNPDKAFDLADKIVSTDTKICGYTVPPLEPYGILASYERGSGILTEWCNFIGPFSLFYVVSKALRLTEDRFRVIVPKDNGGSFGTKLAIYPYMALLGAAAMITGLPLKWVELRSEHFVASTRAATRQTHFELAVTREGKITGLRARIVDDIGAYPRSPEPGHLLKSLGNFAGPYKIENISIDASYVVTNTVPTSPIRAFGRPHHCVSLEKTVDKAARELGIDPVEIRLKNFIGADEFPYKTVTGGLYDSGRYSDSIHKLLKLLDYWNLKKEIEDLRKAGRHIGLGIAVAIEPSVSNMAYLDLAFTKDERAKPSFLPHSGGQHSATVKMEPSGTVTVQLDSTPQGQGHETVGAQIVASLLGVRPEEVRVITGIDTQKDPWSISSGTYASRFGSLGISAAYTAAMKVREKLLRAASKLL